MTLPTPNRGAQANSFAQVKAALDILERALPGIGSESESGSKLLRIITDLAKMVPPGSTSQGVQNQTLQNLMMQQRQEQPMQAALRQMAPGGAPAPAAPPPAAA